MAVGLKSSWTQVHVRTSCCKDHGVEPPALDASEQRVRPADVLLPKNEDPLTWAKSHLANGLYEPV